MNNHSQFFLPFRCNFFLHLPQAAEKACSPKRRARTPSIESRLQGSENPTRQSKRPSYWTVFCFGPSRGIRTPGILLPKQARYQLRYTRLWSFRNKRYSNILHMINARGIRRKSQQICWPNTFIISAPIAIVNRKCNCNTQICVLTKNKCAYSWRIPSWNHRCRVLYYRHKEHIICQMYSKYFS